MLELVYNICVKECCSQFVIEDATGYYHATDNPGGWGLVNPSRPDITEAFLSIIGPDGTTYNIDILAEVLADDPIIVSYTQVGLTTPEIVSGQYQFTITLNSGDLITPVYHTYFESQLVYCLEEKKICNLIGTTDFGTICSCKDGKKLSDILDIWVYLMALKNAACCGKTDRFNELLEIINSLLNSKPCKNC